jgi:hypothetical protein
VAVLTSNFMEYAPQALESITLSEVNLSQFPSAAKPQRVSLNSKIGFRPTSGSINFGWRSLDEGTDDRNSENHFVLRYKKAVPSLEASPKNPVPTVLLVEGWEGCGCSCLRYPITARQIFATHSRDRIHFRPVDLGQ